MFKYAFQPGKYPLFLINPSKGGILKSGKLLNKLKLCKLVKYKNYNYFSLTVPHWPSEPFDHMVANGGLNIAAAGTQFKKQIDIAIIGITGRCNYQCAHCYEHFNIGNRDVLPLSGLKKTISQLQEYGVSIITFSGGEPLQRFDDLVELLETGDASRSDFHIHTSGYGLTREMAVTLKKAGLHAAGIGLDDVKPDRNDTFRGYKGAFEQAIHAINTFRDAGVFTYVNTCLTKELVRSGDLPAYFDLLRNLGVGIVRWLEPKPCGAYLQENVKDLFSDEDRKVVTDFYIRANTGKDYKDYPLISYEAFAEAPENMGCMMAGHSHLYIDSSGNVEPCVFLPVSFGNIMEEDFQIIFNRMRDAIPKPLHVTCPSLQLNDIIKIKKDSGIPLPVPHKELTREFIALSGIK
jgi:MoaA/NifB/PqqE/SkfB family radical SAM enzyme